MEFHTDMVATESISDASLVARCRAGDDEAWEELVRRFSRYVLAIAQLTRRLCIDRIRAGSREVVDPLAAERGADDTLEKLDEALSVQDAMHAMSEPCREVLDRFFCRDESYAVIGSELGLPSGTIASRISRCLAKLRDQFEGRRPGPRPS